MAWKKPKITKKEVSQKFNLGEYFGVDFGRDPDLKLEIGQAIIDKIIERTEDGQDISENDFKKYSKEYVESDEFKDFGKSKNEINMTLTGRMLDDIDIISESRNTIKIGFEDETETLKAFNHNTGDTVKKRKFFGIRSEDLKEIGCEFRDELKAIKPKKRGGNGETPDRQTITSLLDSLSVAGLPNLEVENPFGES